MLPRLRNWLAILPGEGLAVAACFAYIAVTVASFLLAKPIRNGLFLHEFGAYKLAYVYVVVPLVLTLFVPLYSRVTAWFGPRVVTTGTLLFFCVNVLVFWYGLRYAQSPWLAAAFYVWVNCYGVIAPVQAWTFANSVFDVRQARRLFGLIGSGASFGAVVGGVLARELARPIGTVNLLLVLAALILSAAVIVNVAWRVRRRQPELRPRRSTRMGVRDTARLIRDTPYLRLLAIMVLVVAMVTQMTQFQFSLVADRRFASDVDRITSLFGTINTVMGIVAFVVQIVLTGPALRRFGIGMTILLLPLALGFGSMLVVLWPALWSVLTTTAIDQGLRFSIDKATYELLYLPIPQHLKTSVKGAIDLIVNRLGEGFAGVLLGVATGEFASMFVWSEMLAELRGLATLTLIFIAGWVVVALATRREYVNAIQESIRQHRLDTERVAVAGLDKSTADILAGRLIAVEPKDILYALSVFESEHSRAVHPTVRDLLVHPHAEIRARALALLDRAGDLGVLPRVEELLQDPDLSVRTEALLFLAHHAKIDPLERIQHLGGFTDFSIRAGMVAFLSQPGPTQNLDAARVLLDGMAGDTGPDGARTRAEAARLLRLLPDEFGDALSRLLLDEDASVVKPAIWAAVRLERFDAAPSIVARLGDATLGEDAAPALVELGPPIVPALAAGLSEGSPLEVRREAPGVLAQIGTMDARRALTDHLLDADPAQRMRILTALNKHAQRFRHLPEDRSTIEMVLTAEVMGHYRSYQLLGSLLSAFDQEDTIVLALRRSMDQEVERIFRLLALLWPDRDLHSAYVGVESGNSAVRASALEFLDNVLEVRLRSLIVPLLDPQVSIADRVVRANQLLGARVESRQDAIVQLLENADPWLQACGAYAVGALGLVELAGRLDALEHSPDALLRETVRVARRRLAAPSLPEQPAAVAGAETGKWEPGQGTVGVG